MRMLWLWVRRLWLWLWLLRPTYILVLPAADLRLFFLRASLLRMARPIPRLGISGLEALVSEQRAAHA